MSENVKVIVNEKQGVEKAIRYFTKKCNTFGVTKEYRRRKEYQKPSVAKKHKREEAEKRRRKNEKLTNRNRSKF